MSRTDGSDRKALLREALGALDEMQAKLDASERSKREPVAIVGVGCRFPGHVTSPETYWTLLEEGHDGVQELAADRMIQSFGQGARRPVGGFLDSVDLFDAAFFGISPREAATMDPQHRMLLEVVWEALERAGQPPDRLAGTRTGVFVGITTSDYAQVLRVGESSSSDVYSATGNALNAAAGRISFLLGLRGPTMSVDTACSSSLTAVHLACQSLRSGESRMALACGVNLVLLPHAGELFTKWGMMAADGRCKTFDASADGFVRSEGCAALVLKRLSDAIADGDPIHGVIRGSAVNSDGRSSGLTVPNGPAQEEVIRAALASASVSPAQIDYLEAHGTGTPLGDPIEAEALAHVFAGRPADRPLFVGSVKTNIGHCEAASGLAGVIKVLLSLQHETIPAHLHFRTLSPRIEWSRSHLAVPDTARPWPRGARPRLAGVSSFGFSGTNAHVIIEEAPILAPVPAAADRPIEIVALSAKSDEALVALAGAYADRLDRDPAGLKDLSFTATRGRAQFGCRAAAVGASATEMAAALRTLAAGVDHPAVRRGDSVAIASPRIAFAFTGQGAQYVNMGRELFETEPRFRQIVEQCSATVEPVLGRSLVELLYPSAAQLQAAESEIHQTRFTQPALFVVEYALAQLLREWGVEPVVVLGHSVGEYVAAAVAGVFEPEAALHLIARRAALMQALPSGGAMAAVFGGPDVVASLVAEQTDRIAIAAVNGPALTVISGAEATVRKVCADLAATGVRTQALAVSHAFHSPLLDPMLAEFERIAEGVARTDPRIPIVSNVTAELVHHASALDGGYWRRHARQTVRFADSVATLARTRVDIVIEVGPHPALTAAGRTVASGPARWVPTLRRKGEDCRTLLTTIAELFAAGVPIDWASLDRSPGRRKIDAPTYPFQRQRYWAETSSDGGQTAGVSPASTTTEPQVHPMLGRRLRSPAMVATVFERELTDDAELAVREHRVFGLAVVPGAAYLDMAATAGRLALAAPVVVLDLSIHQPLVPGAAGRVVQTVFDEARGGAVRIYSRAVGDNSEEWQLHASARIERQGAVDELVSRARQVGRADRGPVDSDGYYARLESYGVAYGAGFRALQHIVADAGAASASIGTDAIGPDAGRYPLHPAIIDAAFQLVGPALDTAAAATSADSLFLPLGVARFAQLQAVSGPLLATARLQGSANGETITADIAVTTAAGEPVALIEGLVCKSATADGLRRAMGGARQPLYTIDWERLPPVSARLEGPRSWLLLADAAGGARALADLLIARGEHVVVIATNAPGDEAALLAVVTAAQERHTLTDVVHLRSLDLAIAAADGSTGAAAGAEVAVDVCTSLLHLVQALAKTGSPRLTIVTAGAQAVAGHPDAAAADQALAIGLGRTIANEYPAMACKLVDVDARSPIDGWLPGLVSELDERDRSEPQVALRDDHRSAPRLIRPTTSSDRKRLAVPSSPYALVIEERGIIDNLRLQAVVDEAPRAGEVRIAVTASGLNFRDVLSVLGMYPGPVAPLGGEVVGRVDAVGAAVTRFKVGDEVLALTPQGFCDRVSTPESLVWERPTSMTREEAATIPIVFHTAHYALTHVARMRAGDRVLIHAGAGGVGLAAIQLAQHAGAEIFATAGSEEKRTLLRQLGVQWVMDSRTLGFADEIRHITRGEGIDIVLNSLAGEFIPRSLSILRQGGRFLELGKTDLWDQERVTAVQAGVQYHPIFLGDVCGSAPELVERMFAELMPLFESGVLRPLPSRSYGIDDAPDAFRYMAQARHIGKVVIWQQPASERPLVRADGTYLVTGGLGGVGLHVARWLAQAGAGRIVLIGRRGPDAAALQALSDLRRPGTSVEAVVADVTDRGAVAAVVRAASVAGAPLRGIVHAAGVLDDGVLAQLTAERFARVVAPKLLGARNLLAAADRRGLDFVVLCSAGAALFGPPGQGSYAAANAALDVLAAQQTGAGVPALSINWGAWKDTGMASRLTVADLQRWKEAGVLQLDPEEAVQSLAAALRSGRAQVAVLPADWAQAGRTPQARVAGRLLARLLPTAGAAAEASGPRDESIAVRKEIADAAPQERRGLLMAHVRSQLRRVLGMGAGAPLRTDTGFADLGMDSLMSVELSNRLRESLGCSLPATLAFEHPTVERLTDYLARQVLELEESDGASDAGPSAEDEARARLQDGVERLTDAEVERSLAAELDSAGY